MNFIQEITLVETGAAGVCLVRTTRDLKNRVIKYDLLDCTPIHPSSPYYEDYLRAKANKTSIAHMIAKSL